MFVHSLHFSILIQRTIKNKSFKLEHNLNLKFVTLFKWKVIRLLFQTSTLLNQYSRGLENNVCFFFWCIDCVSLCEFVFHTGFSEYSFLGSAIVLLKVSRVSRTFVPAFSRRNMRRDRQTEEREVREKEITPLENFTSEPWS